MSNTPEEQARLDYIHTLPCICCSLLGVDQLSKTEAHHIVDKGYREHSGGHMSTLPLCAWHHRGICADGYTSTTMRAQFGPSLELEKRSFKITFGGERALLKVLEIARETSPRIFERRVAGGETP